MEAFTPLVTALMAPPDSATPSSPSITPELLRVLIVPPLTLIATSAVVAPEMVALALLAID